MRSVIETLSGCAVHVTENTQIRYCAGFELRHQPPAVVITHDGNSCTLIVERPKTGEYRCIAYNAAGQATCAGIVRLQVERKFFFTFHYIKTL